jgi:hypothetical protein
MTLIVGLRSAGAVGGLDFADVHVAGPVHLVQVGAGDRVAVGRRRAVLRADSQLQSLRSLATAASEPAVAAMLSRLAAGRERG